MDMVQLQLQKVLFPEICCHAMLYSTQSYSAESFGDDSIFDCSFVQQWRRGCPWIFPEAWAFL
jgi:hypothetical protein